MNNHLHDLEIVDTNIIYIDIYQFRKKGITIEFQESCVESFN